MLERPAITGVPSAALLAALRCREHFRRSRAIVFAGIRHMNSVHQVMMLVMRPTNLLQAHMGTNSSEVHYRYERSASGVDAGARRRRCLSRQWDARSRCKIVSAHRIDSYRCPMCLECAPDRHDVVPAPMSRELALGSIAHRVRWQDPDTGDRVEVSSSRWALVGVPTLRALTPLWN